MEHINISTGAYPHPVECVEAKLYKQWWSQREPDHIVEVPARAIIANGKELISKVSFHQWIVFEGELYKARECTSTSLEGVNEYEWENTVFLSGKGYGIFNSPAHVRAEVKLASALHKLSEQDMVELADAVVQLLKTKGVEV